MRFIHRVGLRATEAQLEQLEKLGVTPKKPAKLPGARPLLVFDIDEAHTDWEAVSRLLHEWGASDLLRTEFSRSEIAHARWLQLQARTHTGYPQPDEDSFGYREATYDFSHACKSCGVGRRQNAPFQMTGEPRWGLNGLLQMNWIFDEFFARTDVWESVFAPHGVQKREVLDTSGRVLESVVQLVIEQGVDVCTTGLANRLCAECSEPIYAPVTRGMFPALTTEPASAAARTNQYFGGGAWGYRPVLIRADLAASLTAAEVRGFRLRPVANCDLREHS